MNLSLFLILFQIAVLLIDCQGTGDNLQSDTKFDTQIMFLSVEMSTYQILNATKNVTSTDLLGLKVKKVWVNFRYTWVIRHFFYHCLARQTSKINTNFILSMDNLLSLFILVCLARHLLENADFLSHEYYFLSPRYYFLSHGYNFLYHGYYIRS